MAVGVKPEMGKPPPIGKPISLISALDVKSVPTPVALTPGTPGSPINPGPPTPPLGPGAPGGPGTGVFCSHKAIAKMTMATLVVRRDSHFKQLDECCSLSSHSLGRWLIPGIFFPDFDFETKTSKSAQARFFFLLQDASITAYFFPTTDCFFQQGLHVKAEMRPENCYDQPKKMNFLKNILKNQQSASTRRTTLAIGKTAHFRFFPALGRRRGRATFRRFRATATAAAVLIV